MTNGVCLRLGLPLAQALHPAAPCKCGASATRDDEAMWCPALRSQSSWRHVGIIDALARIARAAGIASTTQPPLQNLADAEAQYSARARHRQLAAQAAAAGHPVPEYCATRGDLLMRMPANRLARPPRPRGPSARRQANPREGGLAVDDVPVTAPTAQTCVHTAARASCAAAWAGEYRKRWRHDQHPDAGAYVFRSVYVQFFGRLGEDAMAVIAELADCRYAWPQIEFKLRGQRAAEDQLWPAAGQRRHDTARGGQPHVGARPALPARP